MARVIGLVECHQAGEDVGVGDDELTTCVEPCAAMFTFALPCWACVITMMFLPCAFT